jgi:hypothetical protein
MVRALWDEKWPGAAQAWFKALVSTRLVMKNDTNLDSIVVKYSVRFVTDTHRVTKIKNQR